MNSPVYKGHNDLTWSRPSASSKLVVRIEITQKFYVFKLILGVAFVRGPNQTYQNTNWRQPCTTWSTFIEISLKTPRLWLQVPINRNLGLIYINLLLWKFIFHLNRIFLWLVRFNAVHRIKSYDPQLERFTVNSFKFQTCVRSS